ncbi:MAG: DUF932 domain-containing protein [Thermoguttaceae bacterium]|jgi:phage/plasmid-like protein (TIGR03299 family)
MPANVGEMFYYGETPWHGLGVEVGAPLSVQEALRKGSLDWEVGTVKLQTLDKPPSPVPNRQAIVRLDRLPGSQDRVLGVVHLGFKPVQNRDAAMLLDTIFGRGKPVYHTGGYLGHGEMVWLLAKIDKQLVVGAGDIVEPYALMANSHDGSRALTISLTTVRVVCENTLNLALRKRGIGPRFWRSHHGTIEDHTGAAETFFASFVSELDNVASTFQRLAHKKCRDWQFSALVAKLFRDPARPLNADQNPTVRKAYETRMASIQEARRKILELRVAGRGADLPSARGTFWGALNAITEFVDHHQKMPSDRLAYALLGDGQELKMRAYREILKLAG